MDTAAAGPVCFGTDVSPPNGLVARRFFFFQTRIVILQGFDVRIWKSICDGPGPQGSNQNDAAKTWGT